MVDIFVVQQCHSSIWSKKNLSPSNMSYFHPLWLIDFVSTDRWSGHRLYNETVYVGFCKLIHIMRNTFRTAPPIIWFYLCYQKWLCLSYSRLVSGLNATHSEAEIHCNIRAMKLMKIQTYNSHSLKVFLDRQLLAKEKAKILSSSPCPCLVLKTLQ